MSERDGDIESTVRSNLGLTAEDLGVSENDGDANLGQDTSDDGTGSDSSGADLGEGRGTSERSAPDADMGERPARRSRDQFGREPKQRQQQGQRDQQQQQRFPASAEVRPDAKGNLLDGRGNIVARAGKEARFYQQAANATRQLMQYQAQAEARFTDLQNRLNRAVEIGREVYGRFEQLQAQNAQMSKMGISPQEQMEAMQLVAMSKTNPIQALKTLLTRAAANGIDLSELGVNGGGDTKAIVDLIKTEIGSQMQPLRERTEAAKRQEQQNQQQARAFGNAKVEVANFFAQNPEARQYLPVLDATLQKYPEMSLNEAWARFQLFMVQRQQQQQNNTVARTRQRGAFPNGVGRMPARTNNGMASVSRTYEQIARDVMNEVGM